MAKRQTTLDLFTGGRNRTDPKPKNMTSKYFSTKDSSSNSVEILSPAVASTNSKKPGPVTAFSKKTTPSFTYPNNFTPPPPPKCVLISNERFELSTFQYLQPLSDACQTVPTAVYNPSRKRWNFQLSAYNDFLKTVRNFNPKVEELPNVVKIAFQSIISARKPKNNDNLSYDMKDVDKSLLNILFPFQLEAVNFVISKNGRALIADEMGLGKTLEALAVASFYVNEWPLLIVTPANVRHTWVKAVRQFFSREYLSPHNVFSPNGSKEMVTASSMPSNARSVVIVSYDLLKTQEKIFLERNYRIVILDESHFIKNFKSDRFKVAFKILKKASRAVLLTGTPALSRPVELFPQLQCINEKLFKNFNEFVYRYCDAKMRPKHFGGGLDTTGSSNLEELEVLLKETVMIRRIKADVMNQLQPKKRFKIILAKNLLETKDDDVLDMAKKNFFDESLTKKDKRKALVQFFNATSKAKIKPVVNHILSLVRQGRKMVVFAHHQLMMNSLQTAIGADDIQMIRIDGATSSECRQRFCDRFQNDDKIKVALLSITAACTGLTLTAANLVVFAELFWNPGVLAQAEDRVHRKGQELDVEIIYLIAQGTADEEIWRLLGEKNVVLGKGGLSEDNFENVSTTTVTFQQNLIDGSSRKTTLQDFWDDQNVMDQNDDVEILDENVYNTKSGLKINLNDIIPSSAIIKGKNIQHSKIDLKSYPTRSCRNFLPLLKISEIRRSLTNMRICSGEGSSSISVNQKNDSRNSAKYFLDTTFCDNIEDLFYDKSSNRSNFNAVSPMCEPSTSKNSPVLDIFVKDKCPKVVQNCSSYDHFTTPKVPDVVPRSTYSNDSVNRRVSNTYLDAGFVDNVEDFFNYRAESPAPNLNIDTPSPSTPPLRKRPKISISPKLELDFSFDFGLKNQPTFANRVKKDAQEEIEYRPPSPESLPVQKVKKIENFQQISYPSLDDSSSPIFRSRFTTRIKSQKPLATVRPFKINDDVVNYSFVASTSTASPAGTAPRVEELDNYRSPFRKKTKPIRYGNEFIDGEAEQADIGGPNRIFSSDESDLTDDDNACLIDSFVDHDSEPEYFNTQKKSNSPEMKAIYLKSLNSSQNFGRRNKYKLAYGVGEHLDVYSQRPAASADDTMNDDSNDMFAYDSFVVPNDFVEYVTEKKREKFKKTHKSKRRRLLTQMSSDSDDS